MHEQPRGIGAVFLDQRLRIDAVVLRFRHRAEAAILDRLHRPLSETAPMRAAVGVELRLDLGRIEKLPASIGAGAEVDVVQHHALRQQVRRRARIAADQPQIAHRPASRSANTAGAGSRARCRRCTDRPAASSCARSSTARCILIGAGVAQEVPGGIDEGVHGVGFAPRGSRHSAGTRTRRTRPVARADCRCHRAPGSPAAPPAARSSGTGTSPQPGNGSAGSGSPSSAGARCPSRAGATARACVRAPCARGPPRWHRWPVGEGRPLNSPESTSTPFSAYWRLPLLAHLAVGAAGRGAPRCVSAAHGAARIRSRAHRAPALP